VSIRNVILIRWGDGFIEGVVEDSETTYGRKETLLSISNVTSGPSALWTAYATIVPISVPEVSIVVGIEPEDTGDEPYSAFDIGDAVTCDDIDGTPTSYRVAAISCNEDDDGNLSWFPELATARDIQAQRWERWLRRTANGTLDGRSRAATPTSPSIINAGKVNVQEFTFSTGGGSEALIGDRGSPARLRENMLLYRGNGEADVAGISGDTTASVEIDAVGIGESITIADTEADGFNDFAAAEYAPANSLLNVEVTANGGHVGVNFTVLGVTTQ